VYIGVATREDGTGTGPAESLMGKMMKLGQTLPRAENPFRQRFGRPGRSPTALSTVGAISKRHIFLPASKNNVKFSCPIFLPSAPSEARRSHSAGRTLRLGRGEDAFPANKTSD